MLNPAFHYRDDALFCDDAAVSEIARAVGTPVYIYSLKRAFYNYAVIRDSFRAAGIHADIHYSAKANGNLAVLGTLIGAGAGIDAVSGGEIFRALKAGARPANIVFAGVGKSAHDLRYALQNGVGWINIENLEEVALIEQIAGELGVTQTVALRLNPNIAAKTHPFIATGHGGAKFGMSADVIVEVLARRADYAHIRFQGLHVHIGSQLHDVAETAQAVTIARDLAMEFPFIDTLDIGGGIPAPYQPGELLPSARDFAESLASIVEGYNVILEPGRAIIADAGILVTQVEYVKQQDDETFVIVDAGMTELIRPMLYDAHHEIVPVVRGQTEAFNTHVVGPVCESTDVFARDLIMPVVERGDLLAILTAGAYGMVMSSNYNARPTPPEVVVSVEGGSWSIARRRQTWEDLASLEQVSPA